MHSKWMLPLCLLVVALTPAAAHAGACCLGDGTCVDDSDIWCAFILHGEYLGDGTTCATDACPPLGACCEGTTGQCTLKTQYYCLNEAHGVFHGAGSECANVTCIVGACCPGDAPDCVVTARYACETVRFGQYFGDGSTCEENNCPALGACCRGDATGCQMTTFGYCQQALNGTFFVGQTCAEVTCPVGACCDPFGAPCHEPTTAFSCLNQYAGAYMGDGTTCATITCPDLGACCRSDGFCIRVNQVLCNLWGNTFLGEGTTCDPNPCAQPATGACCQPSGLCQPDMSRDNCENQTYPGVYAGDGTTCDPNPCPQPAFGACCFAGGACLEVEEWQCIRDFGTFQGNATSCCPNPCSTAVQLGWSDDFESYAPSTVLYHVGGWTGWDDLNFAAGTVSTAQAHSGTNSIAVSGLSDAIHPFTPAYTGGKWTIKAWQYIASPLDTTTYITVQSYYEHGGPYFFTVELRFDPAIGVYDGLRDPSGNAALPIIYNQWVEVRIEADIGGGIGTIKQFYNNQQVWNGTWITGAVGQLAIMNVDLYAPQSTPVYYDDLSVLPEGTSSFNPQRPLLAGVQYGDKPARSTNLSGLPAVTWNDSFSMPQGEGISGAAGRPDGAVYLSSGETTSKLYLATYRGPAVWLSTLQYPVSGLAYGKGRLYGFSTSANPMGIYEITPKTGAMTLVVDTGPSRRFFGIDYNAADGLVYGYDEYGSPTGLCSINLTTGVVTPIAGNVPCPNSAARAVACGYNHVYVVPIYGDTCPMYVYDLAQGIGGTWQTLTHPFPDSNSTGGAAFIPGVVPGDMNCDGVLNGLDIQGLALALTNPAAYVANFPDCSLCNADVNADGSQNAGDVNAMVQLLVN